MAEGADAAKRKQPAGRKSRQSGLKRSSSSRVSLEKVLGISTVSSSGLTSDPNSGLIAYPAGCVVVLLHPKKNKQSHIINTSRKPFSALAFSHDGKYLVTGESGHMPCVRVWEVGGGQVAEVQSHKYGVSCVAFSTNSCYIVSVGYQHDMTVSVWDWRKGSIIASNKVSSRVFAVSFSQDSSYFVTAGNRHVKFWYLDASKERRVNSTVPLIGRSGLLGDHKNSVFSGVACGRGLMASSTYCITSSGLLCLFNSSRQLEAWVNLKTSSASCLAVSEDFIFCGCADGLIRVFSPSNLQYITTLHRPHRLGVDLTQSLQHGLLPASPGAQYPDTLALTFDPAAKHLTCVYNDHSVYVWDVRDVRNVGKLYSALYHSSCVWSIEVYPELSDVSQACLPPSSFLTCSSDNTIRLWHTDPPTGHRNLYSNDLLRILYVGENTQHLQAEGERGEAAGADGKAGIRVLGISPDGQHLAAGDRCGNLRIFGLEFLDELVKIEAHDSEVLCLEFSPTSTGVRLLASASRDRLIHVFNLERNYSLEQTLNDHSASITAVKFTGESPEVRMVSCGADKSIYFQAAEQTTDGLSFSRSHHVVEKTTLYDMDLDSSRTHVAIACQDRNVRVYNVETGKLKKCLKGSSSDEGALLKVQMDPSGSFFATSCSDKNITIFDYESGECVATLFGHSEIVTCMRFSQDCRHLITVSGDSCVFVWRLDSQMTTTMRKRQGFRPKVAPESCSRKQPNIRRETFITVPSSQLQQMEEEEEEEVDLRTPARLDSAHNAQLLQTNGKLPMWFRKLQGQGGASSAVQSDAEPRQVRSRWTEQLNPLTICSNFSPSPTKSQEEEEKEGEGEEEGEEEDFHPQSLESLLGEEEEEEEEALQTTGEDRSTFILYPNPNTTSDREFDVEAVTDPRRSLTQLEVRGQGVEPVWSTQLSPDSACSEGSAGSLEQQHDTDTDSLSQGSSVGSLGLEDDDDRNSLKNHFDTLASSLSEEKFDTDLRNLQPPEEKHFLNPRLSISTRFLSRFQDRIRAWPSRAPPLVSIPTRISEESIVSNTVV
ncbi:WD repeat-containing protein 62-like [Lates japonicus]